MGEWVLKRTDSWGGWVAQPGSASSYTGSLQHARRYPSKEAAERDRCPDNEVAQRLEEAR